MNDFFTNLVGRHLGASHTVQPRTPGRFEPDHGGMAETSSGEGTSPALSEAHAYRAQPPGEASYEMPKNTVSEIAAPGMPAVDKTGSTDRPIAPQRTFFVDVPQVTADNAASTGNRKDDSSAILPRHREPSANPGLTEQHTPGVPDDGRDAHSTRINHFNDAMADKEMIVSQDAREHHPEHGLNDRIRAMLQRLTESAVPPTVEPAADGRGSQKHENPVSLSPETPSPLPDTAVASPDPVPALEPEAAHQEGADERENTTLYGRLETPSWLSDVQARFNEHSQEKEAKAEPVINVTIGRVEVRAVQTETPKSGQRSKKRTGVMSLDEYLKRREGRGR
jgi:hypothetical protein